MKEDVIYSVEIEVDGIDVTNLNMTEIQITISNLTSIESDKFRIRVDINDNNEIIRIIVIVDDEETAKIISESINVAIEEHSEEGIVRHFKSSRVNVKENKLSLSCGIMKEGIINIFINVFMIYAINHLW